MQPTQSFNVSHQRQVMSMGGGASTSQSSPPGLSGWGTGMSGNGWLGASPVEILVQRACDPSLTEPPYQVHLELSEYINNKKANTPREAAMAAVRMVNHRNPHVSILALALIDSLVQSGGYPMHLQIATKEFLNELVRRFPERPPPFPGPVMQRILELIRSWKTGICATSRWKEDLGNIRDMHRLLSFKGYRFRDIPGANENVAANAAEHLKSPEELENEDREAQSAKLQELLRRGTPKDLAAAQELMKILAGAEPEKKPDYKAQTLKELNKVEAKVILLNEMLDNVDTEKGEKFVTGDVYDQVSASISAATPKIQGWISDAEAHDPDSLATFLQINDQINNVMARYDAYKRGDYAAGKNPIPPELAGAPAKDSLIDLIDEEAPADVTAAGPGGTMDELAGLFGPSQSAAADPQPTNQLGGGHGKATAADIMGMFNQPLAGMSHPRPVQATGSFGPYATTPFGSGIGSGSISASASPAPTGQIMLPGTPQMRAARLGGLAQGTGSPAAIPSLSLAGTNATNATNTSNTSNTSNNTTAAPATKPAQKDPFADLADLF